MYALFIFEFPIYLVYFFIFPELAKDSASLFISDFSDFHNITNRIAIFLKTY